MSESEQRFPGDPLTRAERAALIQANLQKPQVHHPSCICCRKGHPESNAPAGEAHA